MSKSKQFATDLCKFMPGYKVIDGPGDNATLEPVEQDFLPSYSVTKTGDEVEVKHRRIAVTVNDVSFVRHDLDSTEIVGGMFFKFAGEVQPEKMAEFVTAVLTPVVMGTHQKDRAYLGAIEHTLFGS